MAKFELKLPKMGESVAEATVTNWLKKVGDTIEMDEAVLEIATDKVDSEVPSEVSGTLVEILFNTDDVVQVGQTLAIIETEGGAVATTPEVKADAPVAIEEVAKAVQVAKEIVAPADFSGSDKFFSPLVKNIAKEEGISLAELESISGSGKDGRVNKEDILKYIEDRKSGAVQAPKVVEEAPKAIVEAPKAPVQTPKAPEPVVQKSQQAVPVSVNGGDEIIEMDRMRKLIADHMVMSKQTSPHVTSFVEADVTNMVKWRDKVKKSFEQRENEKITFTPIFVEAVAKAIKDLPMINVQVKGTQIIKKKDINIGMAAALPSGNLIVPVIKGANQLSIVGITKAVNNLAQAARNGQLKPTDTQGGTFTVTNVGSFGSIMGTPIINQPQVAILALGAIKKRAVVVETTSGDAILVRHMMYLSMSYDHRIVDGAMGSSFLSAVAKAFEQWDQNRQWFQYV